LILSVAEPQKCEKLIIPNRGSVRWLLLKDENTLRGEELYIEKFFSFATHLNLCPLRTILTVPFESAVKSGLGALNSRTTNFYLLAEGLSSIFTLILRILQ
jgi:hypothetical protein